MFSANTKARTNDSKHAIVDADVRVAQSPSTPRIYHWRVELMWWAELEFLVGVDPDDTRARDVSKP